jgi:membrane protease YdiL (CAAX protease family)
MPLQQQLPVQKSSHPEAPLSVSELLQKIWKDLTDPTIRLNLSLPWDFHQFGKTYVMAFIYYMIGSMVPLFLILGGLLVAVETAPWAVIHLVYTPQGQPNFTFVLGTTMVSFFCGFGMELWYICSQLKKQGLKWTKVVGLNLDSLNGNWTEAFKRSIMALCIALAGQAALSLLPLPKPHQATADLASNLSGAGVFGFLILAVVAAPFFEEIMFRGYLFNALRSVFRKGTWFNLMHRSESFADYGAVCLSAVFFATAHLDPAAFIHLFFLGVILAELYRRSGTLVCPMLLHAFNNLLATALLLSGKNF